MVRRLERGLLLEASLFALSSLLLYHLDQLYRVSIGVLLFLIPLQVIAARRGKAGLLLGTGIFAAVFLAIRAYLFISGTRTLEEGIVIGVEVIRTLLLLLGLIMVNLPFPRIARTLHRLLISSALLGVVSVPLGVLLTRNAAIRDAIEGMLSSQLARTAAEVAGGLESMESPMAAYLLDARKLLEALQLFFPRMFVADYFILLSFSWWAGNVSNARSHWLAEHRRSFSFGAVPGAFILGGFSLEGWMLWPLIGSLAAIGLDLLGALEAVPALSFVAWNTGLIMLFLYCLQGFAIIRFLFLRHRLPRLLWYALLAGMILTAVYLIGNALLGESLRGELLLVMIIPLLGISENWIRYRIREAHAPDERKE